MTVLLEQLLAVGYLRVSDAYGRIGKDNFFSPIEQRETVSRFAATRPDLNIVEWLEAIDVSSKRGANFQEPDFLRVLDEIKAGRLHAVVVPRFDRFGRDLKESLVMIEEIEKAGGYVISASETTTDDAAGRLARNAFLMFANYQLDRITENWDKVHDHMHAEGRPHGDAPAGYLKVPKGEPNWGTLTVDPEIGPLVTWCFERVAAGEPKQRVMEEAQRRGLPLKSRGAFSNLMRNRVYLGEVRSGTRPPKINAHEALTTPALHAACQKPRKGGAAAPRDHLLTGLVRCAGCGYSMTYNAALKAPSWECHNKAGIHRCTNSAAITNRKLEPYIVELWKRYTGLVFQAAIETADLADLEAATLTAEDDLREWFQNTAAQRADKAMWGEELERRTAIRDKADRELDAARAKAGMVSRADLPADFTLEDLWNELERRGKKRDQRKLLAEFITAIKVTKAGGPGVNIPVEHRVLIEWSD